MALEKEPSGDRVQDLLGCIAQYEREFGKWTKRSEKIIKDYRDDRRGDGDGAKYVRFNILWSNVQTLIPATFSRLPQPDVSRRFRDNDPVGRVAALILERALDFEVQHYPDYAATMRQCVQDRFLPGRGVAWARYEPHFKALAVSAAPIGGQVPEDGLEVTEDADTPGEELDYECSPVDYVNWKDFGHSVARTWEEVTRVWRCVYMSEDAVKERFGEELAREIPYDSSPDRKDKARSGNPEPKQAKIYEIWDKEKKTAEWLSKSLEKIIDERPDPLKLSEFFPCPRPLYATMTNETLVPVPDYILYQDQALELNVLSERIDGLVKALQVKGVYDSAIPELARLFTEGSNTDLIPVKNWAAFAEKNGLAGALDLVDLAPIAKALGECYSAVDVIKQHIYEITGISDIVRGATQASETLGAQQIKQNFVGLRLRTMQNDVAAFAADLLCLKAQIMCAKYSPQTLLKIAAAEQLSDADKQYAFAMAPAMPPPMPPGQMQGPMQGQMQGPMPMQGQPPQAIQGAPQGMQQPPMQVMQGPDGQPMPGPAIELLIGRERMADPEAEEGPNPLRSFRIEIESDSLVQMDEAQDKQDRMEFLKASGTFIQQLLPVAQNAPGFAPLLLQMMKYGVTAFKVGKTIEGDFDQTIDKVKDALSQPQQPRPNPEMMKVQGQMQVQQAKLFGEQQKSQAAQQHEQMIAQRDQVHEQQIAQREQALAAQKTQFEAFMAQQKSSNDAQFQRWEALLKAKTTVDEAEIKAGATISAQQVAATNAAIQQ